MHEETLGQFGGGGWGVASLPPENKATGKGPGPPVDGEVPWDLVARTKPKCMREVEESVTRMGGSQQELMGAQRCAHLCEGRGKSAGQLVGKRALTLSMKEANLLFRDLICSFS